MSEMSRNSVELQQNVNPTLRSQYFNLFKIKADLSALTQSKPLRNSSGGGWRAEEKLAVVSEMGGRTCTHTESLQDLV